MDTLTALGDVSVAELATEARGIHVGNRIAVLAFIGQALAWVVLVGSIWYASPEQLTPSMLLIFLGCAAVSFVVAYMFLLAGREPEEFDWTLANRIRSERTRVARQIRMIGRVPQYFLWPVLVVTLAGIIVDYTDEIGPTTLLLRVGLVGLIGALAIGAIHWLIRRTEQRRLRPLLDRMEQLERQLP